MRLIEWPLRTRNHPAEEQPALPRIRRPRVRADPFLKASAVTATVGAPVSDAERRGTSPGTTSASRKTSETTFRSSQRKHMEEDPIQSESGECYVSSLGGGVSSSVLGCENRVTDTSSCLPFDDIFGSLRRHLTFWESIGASDYVLEVIREGYTIPLIEAPPSYCLENNKSALRHKTFVSQEIQSLLGKGFVKQVSTVPHCVSPLTVAENSEKLRLVLDLSLLNKYVTFYPV